MKTPRYFKTGPDIQTLTFPTKNGKFGHAFSVCAHTDAVTGEAFNLWIMADDLLAFANEIGDLVGLRREEDDPLGYPSILFDHDDARRIALAIVRMIGGAA